MKLAYENIDSNVEMSFGSDFISYTVYTLKQRHAPWCLNTQKQIGQLGVRRVWVKPLSQKMNRKMHCAFRY